MGSIDPQSLIVGIIIGVSGTLAIIYEKWLNRPVKHEFHIWFDENLKYGVKTKTVKQRHARNETGLS